MHEGSLVVTISLPVLIWWQVLSTNSFLDIYDTYHWYTLLQTKLTNMLIFRYLWIMGSLCSVIQSRVTPFAFCATQLAIGSIEVQFNLSASCFCGACCILTFIATVCHIQIVFMMLPRIQKHTWCGRVTLFILVRLKGFGIDLQRLL